MAEEITQEEIIQRMKEDDEKFFKAFEAVLEIILKNGYSYSKMNKLFERVKIHYENNSKLEKVNLREPLPDLVILK